MKKKIYFAGSIRGGRNFADLYRKMIEHMQLTDIVLTEHIGQADSNPQLSAMLSGNPYFVIYPYQTEEELFSLMDKILS